MATLPSEPSPRLTAYGKGLLESLEPTRLALVKQLSGEEEARQAAFVSSKGLQAEVAAAFSGLRGGEMGAFQEALGKALVLADALSPIPPPPRRQGVISGIIEELVTLQVIVVMDLA